MFLGRGIVHRTLTFVIATMLLSGCSVQPNKTIDEKIDQNESDGLSKLKAKDYNGAVADFTKCIDSQPNKILFYELRATAYEDLGNYATALADLNHAIALDPYSSELYALRGQNRYESILLSSLKGTLQRQNGALPGPENVDLKAACEDLNSAVRLDPKNSFAYGERSVVRSTLGDKAGADEDKLKSSELQVENLPEQLVEAAHRPFVAFLMKPLIPTFQEFGKELTRWAYAENKASQEQNEIRLKEAKDTQDREQSIQNRKQEQWNQFQVDQQTLQQQERAQLEQLRSQQQAQREMLRQEQDQERKQEQSFYEHMRDSYGNNKN